MNDESPALRPAIVVKEISGACIETIVVGTVFTIVGEEIKPYGYYSCKGLGVTAIWTDEFKFL